GAEPDPLRRDRPPEPPARDNAQEKADQRCHRHRVGEQEPCHLAARTRSSHAGYLDYRLHRPLLPALEPCGINDTAPGAAKFCYPATSPDIEESGMGAIEILPRCLRCGALPVAQAQTMKGGGVQIRI